MLPQIDQYLTVPFPECSHFNFQFQDVLLMAWPDDKANSHCAVKYVPSTMMCLWGTGLLNRSHPNKASESTKSRAPPKAARVRNPWCSKYLSQATHAMIPKTRLYMSTGIFSFPNLECKRPKTIKDKLRKGIPFQIDNVPVIPLKKAPMLGYMRHQEKNESYQESVFRPHQRYVSSQRKDQPDKDQQRVHSWWRNSLYPSQHKDQQHRQRFEKIYLACVMFPFSIDFGKSRNQYQEAEKESKSWNHSLY